MAELSEIKLTPKEIKHHSKLFIWLASLAFIMSLFLILQNQFDRYHTKKILKETNDQISLLKTQVQFAQRNIGQLRQTSTAWQAQMQQKIAAQPLNMDKSTWTLSEVNYLIQLANYQLTFVKDVATTITLLQTADQRLATLNNTNLNALRTALATTIANLQALPKIDVAGLLAQLHALQLQAAQLPLPLQMRAVKSSSENLSSNSEKSNWRVALKNSWENLQKLIVVHHYDKPIAPLLAQEQQAYLQQNLQLLLQQAQWAVLQQQTPVYQSSLQQAYIWVTMYFASDASTTQAMLQALQSLQKINIQPKTPDLTQLLLLLQRVMLTETKTSS
jgi:uroporphyrin-3 C-methyltransferase